MLEALKHHITNSLAVENRKYKKYNVEWRVGKYCKWITLLSDFQDNEEHLKKD